MGFDGTWHNGDMDKQAKEQDLFNQVLAIAMKEGKLQFSKDADPSQSGVVGENFFLFSRQRKLLISIPLEKLKRNTLNTNSVQKAKGNNGCLTGCGCLGGGVVLLAMLIPSFTSVKTSNPAPLAMNNIASFAKECAVFKANLGGLEEENTMSLEEFIKDYAQSFGDRKYKIPWMVGIKRKFHYEFQKEGRSEEEA
jgi:hypothetical protein